MWCMMDFSAAQCIYNLYNKKIIDILNRFINIYFR